MQSQEFIDIKKQLEENNLLLKKNNILLHEIIKQNQLIAEIVVETIWHYSGYHYWPETEKTRKKRQELEEIYHKMLKKD